MRAAWSVLIGVHGVIHGLGFLKAFQIVPLPQLSIPISRPMGILWLLAGWLLLASIPLFWMASRWFFLVALAGVVLSQGAIIASWEDAKFGSLANLMVLALAVYGAAAWGPLGLRAEYQALVREAMARNPGEDSQRPISEGDLAAVPPQVQRYLRFAGVVGTSRPAGFRVRMAGRIRGAADAPWMPFVAEQHNFFTPHRRYFFLEARRAGIPLDGLHAFGESDARMHIRLLSWFPIVNLSGPDLMRGETVTVFNDLCLFAPGRLLDPDIRWREMDPQRVQATFSHGPHTIRAVLVFDEATGALKDFWSDDRPALSPDGKTLLAQRWSTPLSEHRQMGPWRLASRGEARYATPVGDYAYIEIEVLEVQPISSGDPRGSP